MATINLFDSYKGMVGKLQPLSLPEIYSQKIQKLSVPHQLAIALMLNILSLALPIMMLQVYDRIIPHQSYGTLVMLIIGVLVALAFDAALRTMRAWLVGWSAASQEHAAGLAAIDRILSSDINVFDRKSAGEHLQNLSALGRLREFYSGQAMTALVDLPFASIFLMLIAYLGGVLVFVPIALIAVFFLCAHAAGKNLKKALETRSAADDRKASLVVSILSGIHTAKSIAMEAPMMRRFESVQQTVTEDSYKVAVASGLATTLSAVFGQLSLILTATAGCLLVIHGSLSVGALSACTLLAGRAIQPIQRVLGTWLRLQDLTISREQAEHLFSLPVQKRETTAPAFAPRGQLTLDRVSFSFKDGETPFLHDISLSLEPGKVLAIGGDKASGKSTLLQLMAGILTPQSGMVRVDEIDPATYGLSALAGRIGYMPQQGTIFRGTIIENMTGFRNDEVTISRAKEAGYDLGLDAVIDLLPRGYQTMLSDTAADPVAPGIKQRIALARIMLNNPTLLLFDDADRALDKEGYNRLFRIMGRLKGRCTLVMVSHDQNLLSFADEFYTIENGTLKNITGTATKNLSHINMREKY